jgi:hypothetical protein
MVKKVHRGNIPKDKDCAKETSLYVFGYVFGIIP